MRKWIRRMPAILTVAGILTMSAAAADLDSYSIDDVNKTMTLNGTIAGAKQYDDIAIRLLRPGKTINGASYNPANIKTDFVLLTQVLANANGGYSVTVDMTDEVVGFYPMMVNGRETDIKVFYSLPSTKNTILGEIQTIIAKEKDTAVSELTTYLALRNNDGTFNEYSVPMAALGLSDEAFKQVEAAGFSEAVYTILKAETNLTVDNLPTRITEAAYLELLNEGKGSVETYETAFSLDPTYIAGYDKLADNVKTAFVDSYFKGKKYFTVSAFQNAYKAAVRSALVDAIDEWSEIEAYITDFGADTKDSNGNAINVSGFTGLAGDKKSLFYDDVLAVEGGFATPVAFADFVNPKITAYGGTTGGTVETPNTNTGTPNTSFGGGGGGGGAAVPKDEDKKDEDKKDEEQKDEENTDTPQTPAETAGSTDFSDLGSHSWAEESIKALSEAGIVNGVGDSKFEPARNVTREEFLAMLLRAYGIEPGDTASLNFSDTNKNEWYAPYIAAAIANGVSNGMSGNRFGIGLDITREDAAVLAYRLATKQGKRFDGKNTDFEDKAHIADYASEAIAAMQRGGIINGKGDNMFFPKDTCTRAEAAKIIYTLIK